MANSQYYTLTLYSVVGCTRLCVHRRDKMRILAVALTMLFYSCGQPAYGDNKTYSTEDIRMKWYGCYSNAINTSGSPPMAAAVWCDCILDRLRSGIGPEEYKLRELQGDPTLKEELVGYVLECNPFKVGEPIDIKDSI